MIFRRKSEPAPATPAEPPADKEKLLQTLKSLKEKQALIDAAWKKTGNRAFLEFLLELLPRAFDAERAAIFVHDPQRSDVWTMCGTGLKERDVRVPTQGSVVGEVVLSGKYVMRDHMDASSGAHSWVDIRTGFVTRNALAVPIQAVTSDGIAGVIEILNKKSGAFTDTDRALLERAAFHIQMNIDTLFMKQEWVRVSEKMGVKIKELEKRIAAIKPSA